MAITKAQLLTAVQENLEREDETNIDRAILRTLFKVSNRNSFLSGIDTSNSIDTDTTIIDVPDNFYRLKDIRLQDPISLSFTTYLNRIPYNELLAAKAGGNVIFTPWEFALFNRQIFFNPIPSKTLTVEISYYKIHDNDVDNIEFDDRFLSVLESGSTYETALKYGLKEQLSIWSQVYGEDMRDIDKYAQKPVIKTQFQRP